jgi:hypothetical protein
MLRLISASNVRGLIYIYDLHALLTRGIRLL